MCYLLDDYNIIVKLIVIPINICTLIILKEMEIAVTNNSVVASSTEQTMANQSSGVASSTEPKEPTRG